MADALLSS